MTRYRVTGVVVTGLALLALTACQPAPVPAAAEASSASTSPNSAFSDRQSLNPDNLWDRLTLHEQAIARQKPGLFHREGDVITVLSAGKPFARFSDAEVADDSATWRFLDGLLLHDARSGTDRPAWLLERGAFEFSEEVLLDSDGQIYALNESTRVSPGYRWLATGSFNEMNPQSFTIIDWQGKTAHVFDLTCQTLAWTDADQVRVICAGEAGSYWDGAVRRLKDGRWQITRTGSFTDDSVVMPASGDYRAEDLRLAPAEANAISFVQIAKPQPLADKTAYYRPLGFVYPLETTKP